MSVPSSASSPAHSPDAQAGATVTVTLADRSSLVLPRGASGIDLVVAIGIPVTDVVALHVDGSEVDLGRAVPDGATVEPVLAASAAGREVLRHSTAHVLAQAVLDLWPGAHYGIGPPIEDGFYYDFELPGGARFTDDDLVRIEEQMRRIVSEDQAFVREEHDIAEGLALFADQPFKSEIIEAVSSAEASRARSEDDLAGDAVPGGALSVYRNGAAFVDLCRGPHVPSTGRLGAFKLLRVAGAYWRGDERRPQLQRIYGTAWENEAALSQHLERMEEAERRDHRRIGAEQDLFSIPTEIGGGLAMFHPHGGLIRYLMEELSRREHLAAGYDLVTTPHITRSTLFEISGHLSWYAEGMYPPMEMEGATYYPKPMSCPMHILIYRSRAHSYRELPIRLFELAPVYRFERSGVLHGLTRVRGFTQDDSHIFCAPEQLAEELAMLLDFVLRILRAFGLGEFEAELATRNPDKFVGELDEWDFATEALRQALEAAGLPYTVAEGEGAFYAPKIDVHLRDAIGRRWQVSTLQVDLQLPRRFDLSYVGADNQRHLPSMIHRALFGSVERFFAILAEHHAGAWPLWLAPVQVRVLPVAAAHAEYATEVAERLARAGFRTDVVAPEDTLGARVRRAKQEKLPYVLVVGEADRVAGTVGVNARGSDRPERDVPLGDFVERLAAEARPPLSEAAERSGLVVPGGFDA